MGNRTHQPRFRDSATRVRAAGFELGVSIQPVDDHDLTLIRRELNLLPHQRLSGMVEAVNRDQPDESNSWWMSSIRSRFFGCSTTHRVEFLVVGGIAADCEERRFSPKTLTSPRRPTEPIWTFAAALKDLEARLRTATEPDGVPFPFDPGLLENAAVWTLITKHGDLDLVVSPAGTAGYQDLIRDADELKVATEPDLAVQVASLADVIRSKEAAGREKDRAALPLLEEPWKRPPAESPLLLHIVSTFGTDPE